MHVKGEFFSDERSRGGSTDGSVRSHIDLEHYFVVVDCETALEYHSVGVQDNEKALADEGRMTSKSNS